MPANELVELDSETLHDRLRAARRELYELRFKAAVGQLDNHRAIRKTRKDIARILTVLHLRVLELEPEPDVADAETAEAVAAGEAAETEGAQVEGEVAEAEEGETAEPEQVEASAPEPEAEPAKAPARRSRRAQPAAQEEDS